MRLRTVIWMLACLAVGAAAVLGASGCGSTAAIDPVAQAAETTQHEGGSRMALSASFQVGGTTISMTGSGSFNYKGKEGTFSMAMSGLPGIPQLSPSGELKIDERIKGTTVYVGSDVFAGKLPNGARWAKIDLSKFGGAYGLDLSQLSAGQSNPAQMLDFLKASAGGVKVVGHQRVRGVQTTRYRGRLDLEKIADLAPSSLRMKTREAMAQVIAKTGARFIPAEVWIDAQGRVRRFVFSMTVSQGGQSVVVAMQIELFAYGPTPAVQAPPAGETYDLTPAAFSGLSSGG